MVLTIVGGGIYLAHACRMAVLQTALICIPTNDRHDDVVYIRVASDAHYRAAITLSGEQSSSWLAP